MSFLYDFFLLSLALIGALTVVTYFYDRYHIKPENPNPNPPVVLPPEMYGRYGIAVCRCVAANHSACGLCCPKDWPQHMTADGSGIGFDPAYGGTVFFYWFDRIVYFGGGLDDSTFSTVPVERMAQELNRTLSNYCIAHGLENLKIVDQKDVGDGKVVFMVGRKGGTSA